MNAKDFEKVEVPQTTNEGLTYLLPAVSSLSHGVDNVEGAESVYHLYSNVSESLSMARMDLRFGGNDHDTSIQDVAESIIRLRNGGDHLYVMESALRHIMSGLELEGAHKSYWPDEVFMHILKAADDKATLVLPSRWDDPSSPSINMKPPSLVATSSYRVSGDVPAPSAKDIANVHFALVKMNDFLKSSDSKVVGVDGKPLEQHDLERLSKKMTNTMLSHANMGQQSGLDLDPHVSFAQAKQKKAERFTPNKVVSVIGPSSAMLEIANRPMVNQFSSDQSFVIAASRNDNLYVFTDPDESDLFLRNSKEPCFIGVNMSQKEIDDIQFHIRVVPAKMALMMQELSGNQYLDGKLLGKPELSTAQVVQQIANAISKVLPGVEPEVFKHMPVFLSSNEWSGVKNGEELITALFHQLPREYKNKLKAVPLVSPSVDEPKIDVETPDQSVTLTNKR